jgi:hypothetical protein
MKSDNGIKVSHDSELEILKNRRMNIQSNAGVGCKRNANLLEEQLTVEELRHMRLGTLGTELGKLKWDLRMMRLCDSEYRRLIALIADMSRTNLLHPSLPQFRKRKEHLCSILNNKRNNSKPKFENFQDELELTDDDKQFLRLSDSSKGNVNKAGGSSASKKGF